MITSFLGKYRKLALVFGFICLGIILMSVGRLVWVFRHATPLQSSAIAQVTPSPTSAPAPAPSPDVVLMENAMTQMDPRTRFELCGILAPRRPREEIKALIRDTGSNTTAVYRAGATLPQGARLEKVLRDRVVIRHTDNGIVVLYPPTAGSMNMERRGFVVGMVSSQIRTVSRADMKDLGVVALIALIRGATELDPEVDEFLGVRGTSFEGALRVLGLEKKDQILSINGKRLENIPDTAHWLMQSLDGSTALKMTIIRKNQSQTLTYYLT